MPRVQLPALSDGLSMVAYQVMTVPLNCDTASFVTETGSSLGTIAAPRVLIPLEIKDGAVDLAAAHRPWRSSETFGNGGPEPILIWIDIRSSTDTAAGTEQGNVAVVSPGGDVLGSVPVSVTVDGFEMPAKPTVQITAGADWNSLQAAFPGSCAGLTPRLLDRSDARNAPAISLLDQLVATAHENRVGLYVPDIRPVVKWPVDAIPISDWSLFDALVGPWFDGTAFADKRPVAFWPMPAAQSLGQFDGLSQTQYWQSAAVHFAAKAWPTLSPAVVPIDAADDASDSIIAAQARSALGARPPIRVMVPSTIDRFAIETAQPGEPTGVAALPWVITRSPGAIYPSPLTDVKPDPGGLRWIDAQPRLGTEQQIRSNAWVAFLRGASIVRLGSPIAMPDQPGTAATAWFYPGRSFGVDGPLQTVQLKWARQAEQDYEYLVRSNQRGRGDQARQLCRLVARSIRLRPTQGIDAEFKLMTGQADPAACEQCRRLLVAGDQTMTNAPTAEFSRWVTNHQSPAIVPTGVTWQWHQDSTDGFAPPTPSGRWVSARVSCDVYNPGESSTFENQLGWATAAHGWGVHPQPVNFPAIAGEEIRRVDVSGSYDLGRIDPRQEGSVVLNYTDGYTRQTVPVTLNLPVAASDRRTRPVDLDGSLQDWSDEDALNLDRPLVKMLSRSSVQQQTVQPAELPAAVYSGWSDDNFYVAFRLGGVSAQAVGDFRNDVVYQDGRAWGEDLCELLIQPVYTDDTTGAVMHIVCKPGGVWIERKNGESSPTARWIPYEAGGIRIHSTVDPKTKLWRGELSIPWRAIAPPARGRPRLLRFNFIQHRADNGESASWAGPLYESRQSGFTGLLLVRDQTRLVR